MQKNYQSIQDFHLPEPIYRLTLRPTLYLIIIFVIGVAVFVYGILAPQINWLLIIFGLYFAGMPVYSSFIVKNRIVADLYEDSILLYDRFDQTKGVQLKFEEVKSWKYTTGVATGDTMTITMQDDQVYLLESFKSNRIIKHFFARIPEKEERRKIFDILRNK